MFCCLSSLQLNPEPLTSTLLCQLWLVSVAELKLCVLRICCVCSSWVCYNPVDDCCDVQIRSLLLRDPHAARQPYKAAIEDTMILTMKGISSGMQNTG